MPAWFYILRLRSGQLYLGATTDLNRRWEEHRTGIAGRTTQMDPVVASVYQEQYETFTEASKRESQVKPRRRKRLSFF
jgi:putative endonuclease